IVNTEVYSQLFMRLRVSYSEGDFMRKILFWLFSMFLFVTLPAFAQHGGGGRGNGGGNRGGNGGHQASQPHNGGRRGGGQRQAHNERRGERRGGGERHEQRGEARGEA